MNSNLRRLRVLTLFIGLAAVSYALAFALRFGGEIPPEHRQHLLATTILAVVAKVTAFVWFRLHRQVGRYVSFEDLITIAKATTASAVGLTFLVTFFLPYNSIPRGVLLIDWGATLVAIGVARSLPRAVRHLRIQRKQSQQETIALIVGANDEGEALLRAVRTAAEHPYRVVGFLDDHRGHQGRSISGVPVLGALEEIAAIAEQHGVQEVLIAGGMPGKQVRQLVDEAQQSTFQVRVMPSYDQLLRESVSIQPRPVAIGDLLRREPVQLNDQEIHNWIDDKTVLVTGSSGSIGSEMCRQLLKLNPAKVVLVDRSETGQFFLERELRRLAPQIELEVVLADLTDVPRLQSVFATTRPDVVFHAAAYKHVPLMEQHPGEGVKNIVQATRNLADVAEESGVGAFVMISTDKAVNPTSIMGSCKRLAERYVQSLSATSQCRFTTVRFGNVLDSAGSVVPIFREQIAAGGPVTITHPDIIRYFMSIPEAAQLVIQAGAMGQGGEIFVLDMGEPVRIVDLAKDMIRLSGFKEGEDIEIKITGLRPGEKLYEELYAEEEEHRRTAHQKIMVAVSQRESLLQVSHQIGQLSGIANESPEAIRQLLGEIVPRIASPAPAATAELRAA